MSYEPVIRPTAEQVQGKRRQLVRDLCRGSEARAARIATTPLFEVAFSGKRGMDRTYAAHLATARRAA